MNAEALMHDALDREVDLAVAGSFPASDPPPWTLGATPLPTPTRPAYSPAAAAPAAIDVVIAAGRGKRHAATLVEAIALTALVPVGVFAVAAPVLFAVWLFGVMSAWLAGAR